MAWQLRVLIDGECPLCRREGRFMERLDAGRGRLIIEDITRPDFDPAAYGVTMDQLIGAIHGVLPDGKLVTGMEVFRRAYRELGMGWLLAPTGWHILRPAFDAFYRWFARNRLRITRRGDGCATGRCSLGPPRTIQQIQTPAAAQAKSD